MMRLAQSSVARVRLGSVVLPFLRTCRGYSQAVPQPSTSTDSRREVFVDKVADLDEVLESCSRAKSIALDTEFVKFPCFVPKLQLIQVATPDIIAVIDYLGVRSEGLQQFGKVISEKEVVAHSAETDMRLIGQFAGHLPTSLFDTQIATSLTGMGQYLSLYDMVEQLMGVEIDKTLTMTDWSFRPLSKEKLKYAMDDVRYLLDIRDKLEDRLVSQNRWDWFHEEVAPRVTYEYYAPPSPQDLWVKSLKPHKLEGQQLAVLRELFVLRDEIARRANIMPYLVLRDDAMVALATQLPTRLVDLSQIQLLKRDTIEKNGMEIIRRIKKAIDLPESEWPVRGPFARNAEHHEAALISIYQAYIRHISNVKGVAGTLFYKSIDDLKPLAFTPVNDWESLNHPLLKGWRRQLVGNDLIAITKGEKALRFNAEAKGVDLIDA